MNGSHLGIAAALLAAFSSIVGHAVLPAAEGNGATTVEHRARARSRSTYTIDGQRVSRRVFERLLRALQIVPGRAGHEDFDNWDGSHGGGSETVSAVHRETGARYRITRGTLRSMNGVPTRFAEITRVEPAPSTPSVTTPPPP